MKLIAYGKFAHKKGNFFLNPSNKAVAFFYLKLKISENKGTNRLDFSGKLYKCILDGFKLFTLLLFNSLGAKLLVLHILITTF